MLELRSLGMTLEIQAIRNDENMDLDTSTVRYEVQIRVRREQWRIYQWGGRG